MVVKLMLEHRIEKKWLFIFISLSIFRITSLPVIGLIVFLQYRKQLSIKMIKEFWAKNSLLISFICLIQVPLFMGKVIDSLFALNSRNLENQNHIFDRIYILFDSLKNISFVYILMILFFMAFSLYSMKTFTFIYLFIGSFLIFSLSAPIENLQVPIYKSEILAPFVIAAFIFPLTISLQFLKYRKLFLAHLIFFYAVLISYNFYSAISEKLPNVSWGQNYIYEKNAQANQFITYAKINYAPVLLEVNKYYLNCKYLDITYESPFLLYSEIKSKNFDQINSNLNVSLEELKSTNSIKCLVVGNFPTQEFLKYNELNDLKFKLRQSYLDKKLNTSVKIFER